MNSDEIANCRILGFIEKLPNREHAKITVLGYKEESNSTYVLLDKQTAVEWFPENGEVFAPSFKWDKCEAKPNSFVEFSCLLANEQRFGYDNYIVNYDYLLPIKQKIFYRVIPVIYQTSLEAGFITQDELSAFIDKKEFVKDNNKFYLKLRDRLFGPFKYDNDLLVPDKKTQTNEYKINAITYNQNCIKLENKNEYLIDYPQNIGFKQIGEIDCMTDDQLGKWFKKFLESSLSAEKMLTISKDNIEDFVTSCKETNDLLQEFRLKRIKGKFDSLDFNYEEIQNLLATGSPLLFELKKYVSKSKKKFTESWTRDLVADKEKLTNEISDLNKQKDTLKDEIDQYDKKFNEKKLLIDSQIKEKEKTLSTINKNYDSILATFQVALPLLQDHKQTSNSLISPIEFPKGDTTFTKMDEEEGCNFDYSFKKNIECIDLENELNEISTSVLFTTKATFIPCLSWAYLVTKGIRNANLYVLHVEHDWLHYKDFCENGLLDVFNSCYENEDRNHILVFDSINLTQPECGLKPILDIINGYSFKIPLLNKKLPKNLKIMATIEPTQGTNKIGLPLLPSSFEKWGFFKTPKEKLTLPENFLDYLPSKVYCTPKEIDDMIRYQNNKKNENDYYDY